MAGLITTSANPLRLTAYSTAGLPVVYTILFGSEHINITESNGSFYLNPVSPGYAKIKASADGNNFYKNADDKYRIIRVSGEPLAPEVLQAVIFTEPLSPSNVIALELVLPDNPIVDGVVTVPLEPVDCKVSYVYSRPPQYLRIFATPEIPSITAGNLTDFPPRAPSKIGVEAEVIPDAPTINDAVIIPCISPVLNYAINLKTLDIEDSRHLSINRISDQNDRDPYKCFYGTLDRYGFWTYNLPDTQFFKDRPLGRGIHEFYYTNKWNPDTSGKYDGPYQDGSYIDLENADPYKVYWKQLTRSGQSINDPYYMHLNVLEFYACHISYANYPSIGQGLIPSQKIGAQSSVASRVYNNIYDGEWQASNLYKYDTFINNYSSNAGFTAPFMHPDAYDITETKPWRRRCFGLSKTMDNRFHKFVILKYLSYDEYNNTNNRLTSLLIRNAIDAEVRINGFLRDSESGFIPAGELNYAHRNRTSLWIKNTPTNYPANGVNFAYPHGVPVNPSHIAPWKYQITEKAQQTSKWRIVTPMEEFNWYWESGTSGNPKCGEQLINPYAVGGDGYRLMKAEETNLPAAPKQLVYDWTQL